MHSITSASHAGVLWNGPICTTCGKRYLDFHTCSPADLLRQAAELQRRAAELLEAAQATAPVLTPREGYDTSGCPCRQENGGSGVCGCVLGGITVTC